MQSQAEPHLREILEAWHSRPQRVGAGERDTGEELGTAGSRWAIAGAATDRWFALHGMWGRGYYPMRGVLIFGVESDACWNEIFACRR